MSSYKHLKASVATPAIPGNGPCFHRAAALVLDLPGSDLVVGTFRAATPEELEANPAVSQEPFLHAWVEHQGIVYAPTTIEANGNKLLPINRQYYYDENGAHDIKRISRREFITLGGTINLSQHILHGKPTRDGASVGGTILNALGIAWKDSETGGVIPA